MTMETLLDLRRVGGEEKVMTGDERPKTPNGETDWAAFDEMRKVKTICIDHKVDMLSFKMMTSPASEGGKGCQLTDLVEVALHQLKALNKFYPCRENALTITKWEEGLMWQKARTADRVERQVEGKNLK